jgi:hypothetical protein
MFEFEKQYKNYEQAVSRVLETYEYWVQLSLSTIKDMVKTAKAK